VDKQVGYCNVQKMTPLDKECVIDDKEVESIKAKLLWLPPFIRPFISDIMLSR
jgi:hypothetical protein